jgi:outer membrane protein TolC
MDAWMLMKSDKSSLELAKENYRLANLNYSAGNATISDVLQAHALLLQAENTISDRQTTYRVARRRLQDLRNNE